LKLSRPDDLPERREIHARKLFYGQSSNLSSRVEKKVVTYNAKKTHLGHLPDRGKLEYAGPFVLGEMRRRWIQSPKVKRVRYKILEELVKTYFGTRIRKSASKSFEL
jgi:hypothetical protein